MFTKDAQSVLFTIDSIIEDLEYIKSLQMGFGEGFNANDLNWIKIKLKALEVYLEASCLFSGTKNHTGINLLKKNPSTPSSVFKRSQDIGHGHLNG